MNRSIEALVAILAVLKAGGAYLPLESNLPSARIDALLRDAHPALILTDQRSSDPNAFSGIPQLVCDGDFRPGGISGEGHENPISTSGPESLAYAMYTSGSTAKPKGVLVEHRSVIRLVRNTDYCEFGPQHIFLQAAPLSFDASTFEIWGSLLNGSTLVLLESMQPSLDDIARAIREFHVTTAWLTSGLFNLMVEQKLAELHSLKQLLTGGDVVSARHVREALQALPGCRIINGYGPTENTTFSCCHTVHAGDEIADSVPLGKPIANSFVYILDSEGNPVGVGEPGELVTSGDGVARGYLNDEALTRERFLEDPYSGSGQRMYRTGDLARWNRQGEIEFLGRVDDQVKIRGHRVQPLEIAHVLEGHPQIAQAFVLAESAEAGAKRLVAYYASTEELASEQLRGHLRTQLPEYMIPAAFVQLDAVPLTANGKVDREKLSLLAPKPQPPTAGPPVQRLQNDLRNMLQEMWCAVLGTQRVGLDDNFFDLGGDSLLLMSIHSRIQTRLALKLPIMELFEFTTIRKLAERIDELRKQPHQAPARPA